MRHCFKTRKQGCAVQEGKQPKKIGLTKAGTTLFTGNPPSVSSLPITSNWHISIAAWSCWDSSPVAWRPCSSCWALEPENKEGIFSFLLKYFECNKNADVSVRRHYSLAPLPMVLWKSWDMRGPRGPKRCGGRPLASSRAKGHTKLYVLQGQILFCNMRNLQGGFNIPWSLPISESSDSLSPEVVMPTAPATELDAGNKTKKSYFYFFIEVKTIYQMAIIVLTFSSSHKWMEIRIIFLIKLGSLFE